MLFCSRFYYFSFFSVFPRFHILLVFSRKANDEVLSGEAFSATFKSSPQKFSLPATLYFAIFIRGWNRKKGPGMRLGIDEGKKQLWNFCKNVNILFSSSSSFFCIWKFCRRNPIKFMNNGIR